MTLEPPEPTTDETGLEPERVLPPLAPARVTLALIAANAAVFVLETLWGGSEWSPLLYRMGAIAGRVTLAAEPWRTLSAAFLHIGIVHLLANMLVLYVFGRFLEAVLGPWRLLVLYAASALGGGLASTLGHEQRLAAGASGAVWGLMVAEVILLLRPRVLFHDIGFDVDKWQVLQPLVLNLLISLHPAVDLLGHLGGGLAGGAVMASGVLAGDSRRRIWRPAAVLAGAAMAIAVALAFAQGRPWELRAPVLENARLPGAPISLPLPRGAEPVADGSRIRFGVPGRDPLVIECEPERFEVILTPRERTEELAALVKRSAAEASEEGVRQETGPAIVDVAGRPTYYRAFRYPNGARADLWYFIEGRHGLRLMILQLKDAPGEWRALPDRIARGVVFEAENARPDR